MPSVPVSFEFFPPKTAEGRDKLRAAQQRLAALNPEFYSVTYGAGGTTRTTTKDIVLEFRSSGCDIAPHLSFGGDGKEEVKALLQQYVDGGVDRLVALRGDLPSGMGGVGQLVYASELVAFVREHFGDHFTIAVAAYPEIHPDAPNYQADIQFLKQKLDAGANFAITQYFYNPAAYGYFIEQCQKAGIDKPILPGIMPITNFQNLVRFSNNCGADIPRWVRQRLEQYKDDNESLRAFGKEIVIDLCNELIKLGAPGFHFYTMNQARLTTEICEAID